MMPVPMPPSTPYARYTPARELTCAVSTQLAPVSSAPADSNRRGPKRSTRKPWNGDKKVCSTIRIENVTCSCDSVPPNSPSSGLVNSVHTYCGLEMAIMQIKPYTSCIQRLGAADDCGSGMETGEEGIPDSFQDEKLLGNLTQALCQSARRRLRMHQHSSSIAVDTSACAGFKRGHACCHRVQACTMHGRNEVVHMSIFLKAMGEPE